MMQSREISLILQLVLAIKVIMKMVSALAVHLASLPVSLA